MQRVPALTRSPSNLGFAVAATHVVPGTLTPKAMRRLAGFIRRFEYESSDVGVMASGFLESAIVRNTMTDALRARSRFLVC